MSKDGIVHFLRLVDADAATARGLVEAVGQLDGQEAIKAMAAYGRQCGFDVTEHDVADAPRRPPGPDDEEAGSLRAG